MSNWKFCCTYKSFSVTMALWLPSCASYVQETVLKETSFQCSSREQQGSLKLFYLLTFLKQPILEVSVQSWVTCRSRENSFLHDSLQRIVNGEPKTALHVTTHTLTHTLSPKPAMIFWTSQPKAFL